MFTYLRNGDQLPVVYSEVIAVVIELWTSVIWSIVLVFLLENYYKIVSN